MRLTPRLFVNQAAVLMSSASMHFIRFGAAHRPMLAALALVLMGASVGVGSQEPPEKPTADKPGQADSNRTPTEVLDADEIVRQLAARSSSWIMPSAALKTLEYDLIFNPTITTIKATRGERRRESVWMGATLETGFRELMRTPDKFQIDLKRKAGAERLTLLAKLKDENGFIAVQIGNGVENSWSGFFSHSVREATIVVDAKRLVPLEERLGSTTIRYNDWQEIGADKWIPRRIDVIKDATHYRMHFAWLGDAVWLLRLSESIGPKGTTARTRTRNFKVNGREIVVPPTEEEQRSRQAARELLAMLDHNRPWLDDGPTGAGWRPPFQSLSYTFHTVREDVREACMLNREGETAFEVSHDGLGKMKGRLGDRRIALKTQESAVSKRGARFARIFDRSEQDRGQPYDLALKRYARIGCQFDLPLFRYRDQLEFATVAIEDGTRAGRPCRVATVSNLHGAKLGCGTMLAFTSWSYLHDMIPIKEVIEIDPVRNVPIHETLVSSWDKKTFEIDFRDYVEVEPGQWAPRSIRIEANDGFTCEYRFQLVAGTHWMLADVISWFKPEDKSRGVVEDVRIDGLERLDESLRQVEATRALFGGAGESDRRVDIATVPFSIGRAIRNGPYEIKVTAGDRQTVVVSATTNEPTAPDAVPLGFLDEKQRLLFAATVTLADQNGARRGSVSLRSSQPWRSVRSIAVPVGAADAVRRPLSVVPIRWGETFTVNIPDAKEGENPSYGSKSPRAALTRAWQGRLDRTEEGTAKLTMDLVSIDGPREFNLDLAVILLGESGELISGGQLATSLRVVSDPVEPRFEVNLGKFRGGTEPKSMAIGIAPGEILSAQMGSFWGMSMRAVFPFEISALLAAPDESCRRIGLAELTNDAFIRRNFQYEFFEGYEVGKRPNSRLTLLESHVESLVEIVGTSDAADVKANAARLLAYSESERAAGVLEPLAADTALQVREAAAIGLTFLGRPDHLALLRSILDRKAPANVAAPGNVSAEFSAFQRVEEDSLVALGRQRSDAAVDLLGETLLASLEALRPVTDEKGQSLVGRTYRVHTLCKLLGRTENPHAVRWLISATDLIGRRPDLAKHFGRSELMQALAHFPEQTKDRIIAELETGSEPGEWIRAVKNDGDADVLKAIRTMLRRNDLTASATDSGIGYLQNVDTPEALDGLREVYDRGLLRNEPRPWLRLCQVLASRGDSRGLADAYKVLIDLQHPAEPPAEEQPRREWQSARADRQHEAEAVFGRASKELLAEFVLSKTETTAPEERQVVLQLLWKLPDLPQPFAAVLPRWADDANPQVAEQTRRLLDRD